MRQLELHSKISELLAKQPTNLSAAAVLDLISANADAKQYFYSQAGVTWFDWLSSNGFLDVVKNPMAGTARLPELDYLANVAEQVPQKVVDFLLRIPVSAKTFNPPVLGHFWWICKALPAAQLSRIVGKIRDEKWVALMGPANRWFEYKKMFKTLADAKDYESVLVLAEAVLLVRTKDEISRDVPGIKQDNPFYFDDVIEAGVLEALIKIDDSVLFKTVKLTTSILNQIALLGEKGSGPEYFPWRDRFHFYETDFFALKPGQRAGNFRRDDIIEFMAAVKALIERWASQNCANTDAILKFYAEDIDILPHSIVMWRFRLFVLSLCPDVFKERLREAFFTLFSTARYQEITLGTEYELALQKSFHVLSDMDKHDYVAKVIRYFTEQSTAGDKEKEWVRNTGAQILTMIQSQITPEEIQQAKDAGMAPISAYKPEPSIGEIRGGFVSPQGPEPKEVFHNRPIQEIAQKLQVEWSPAKLREQETHETFLTPRNSEGAAQAIKEDMPSRFQEYIANAGIFFERNKLSSHYTYAYLNSVREVLRDNKTDFSNIDWQGLISLLASIRQSGEVKPFARGERGKDSYDLLAGWESVHMAMADVIQELLVEKNKVFRGVLEKYRAEILSVLAYLLNHEDPTPADEEVETAKIKTQVAGSEYMVSDPLTTAINSVRGRGFEAFVQFVYQDGKNFDKSASIKINADVKALYEAVLKKENTRAMMYVFGHYIPSFFFRQKEWVRGLLPVIFPTDVTKKHLYLAAWEGYLATTLYKDIFVDAAFQALYERGVALNEERDPSRRHRKDPDEGIAGHLALAFVNFEGLNFESRLFQAFWKSENTKQQAAFVSFIGRVYVSTENAKNKELLEKHPEIKKKIMDLWDWVLVNCKNPEVFPGFGFWINHEREVFELPWLAHRLKKTLEIVKGVIDWDYGLTMILPQLATVAPADTLAISRLVFLEGGVKNEERRHSFFWDDKCFETLKILYADPATKTGTVELIDDLIREGGSLFWKLKEILVVPDGSKK